MNRIKKSKNQLHGMKDKELKVNYVNHVSISSTNDEYILDFFLGKICFLTMYTHYY